MNASRECPYCLSEIVDSDETIRCDSCGALHHAECWHENGGCCAKSCKKAARSVEIEVEAGSGNSLELSREAVISARAHRPLKVSNPCMRCGIHVPPGTLYCPDCKPESQGSQDTRNAGPLLLMLLIMALAAAWFIALIVAPQKTEAPPPPNQVETQAGR